MMGLAALITASTPVAAGQVADDDGGECGRGERERERREWRES